MSQFIKVLAVALALATPAFAVEPDEILSDPALEERARSISTGLRCVVCQNQNIDSSNAGVARDLRLLVRERLLEGDTDTEVVSYIRARYGDYVLMSPPINGATLMLWVAPFVLVLVSVGVFVMVACRRPTTQSSELSAAENTELDAFLAPARKNGDLS